MYPFPLFDNNMSESDRLYLCLHFLHLVERLNDSGYMLAKARLENFAVSQSYRFYVQDLSGILKLDHDFSTSYSTSDSWHPYASELTAAANADYNINY